MDSIRDLQGPCKGILVNSVQALGSSGKDLETDFWKIRKHHKK